MENHFPKMKRDIEMAGHEKVREQGGTYAAMSHNAAWPHAWRCRDGAAQHCVTSCPEG